MPASATILICDDEPDLRELMRISLDSDFEFAEAESGAEAMELVDRVRPDLVLLDVMLRGTNGLEVVEQMRASREHADTPVLVVSAFAAETDLKAAFDAGATEFLKKPFEPDVLRATVEELLASRR
ncbi:MAG TPA: response regulator [Gaiellaceae bacterium]|jgi:DNA-binding response OmpR family regulator|nr:response regulator [Gaiellaceae bacterium]